jgi:uncharacterized OB-fold protein
MTATSHYPLPQPDAQTRTYWDGCAAGSLKYQSCAHCGRVQLIPRALCEQCQSAELQWRDSARLGTVLSYTTVHRAPLPVFKAMAPYVIAMVDMDEGFRVMANAGPEAAEGMKIGARVHIGFKDVEGMALPVVEALQ